MVSVNYEKLAIIFSFALIFIGILVLLGWIFDIDFLKHPLQRVSMKFATAISIVFSGVTLYSITNMQKSRISQISLPASGIVITLLFMMSIASYYTKISADIANIFLPEDQIVRSAVLGAPSLAAMASFILIIFVTILALYDLSKFRKTLRVFGVVIILINSVGILGHIINSPTLYYSIESYTVGMAVHTAISFVLFGTGLMIVPISKKKTTLFTSIKTMTGSLFLLFSAIPIIFIVLFSYSTIRNSITLQDFGVGVLVLSLVTFSIVTVFGLLTAKSVVQPILALRNITKSISEGNLEKKADEGTNEIGHLGRSFNIMIENIRLNEELRTETETLREINKEKEEFAAMVSHELKTPLVPIQGYAELLTNGRLGDMTEKQREAVRTIHDNAIRLSRLIQDMLDVRKMELGRLRLDIRDTSTKEIIDDCLEAFKTTADTKKISLVDGSQDVPIKCDPERILQVLNNIVNNAMKFVYSGKGRIEISAVMTDGSVTFSVKDNGIGIPKEKQAELFRKFYQVDTSLGRKAGGSGLGLAISKGIIEAHGGKIWVESEEGKGTKVYFSLPKEVSA